MTDDEIYKSNIFAFAKALVSGYQTHEDMCILAELLGLKKQHSNVFERQIDEIIANNLDKVREIKSGKTKLIGFLVGTLMKQNRGADPKVANGMFTAKIEAWPIE